MMRHPPKLWLFTAILIISSLSACAADDNHSSEQSATPGTALSTDDNSQFVTLTDEPFPKTYFTFPVRQLKK